MPHVDPTGPRFSTFSTVIGTCGVAWTSRGIVAVQLPERDAAATRARLDRRVANGAEADPLPWVRDVIDGIVELLGSGRDGLASAPLDLQGVPPFHQRVYDVTRAIPPGTTLTYGDVARRTGTPGAARAVGQALGRNPLPILVPCHRVLGAHGTMGGFSAPGGLDTKRRLLAIEGALLPLS
jgi:methylated-DNA-[protein]-cysteine S-methyltransferase